jgi:hypothetical protein
MVNVESEEVVVRDYSRVAKVLIAIGLRIVENKESDDEPDPGLRASVD